MILLEACISQWKFRLSCAAINVSHLQFAANGSQRCQLIKNVEM